MSGCASTNMVLLEVSVVVSEILVLIPRLALIYKLPKVNHVRGGIHVVEWAQTS